MAYSQINSGAVISSTFEAGADSFFEKVRLCILAAMFDVGTFLGGSRSVSVPSTGYQDAESYISFSVPDSASSGGVYKVHVDLKCENAGTTITPRIRNITDSSDAVVGSAHSSTSWAEQVLTFTPTVAKVYRLQFVKSNDTYACWGIGRIQRTEG